MTIAVPSFKVVTTIQRRSGIERDAVQNTWQYTGPTANPTSGDFGAWMNNYKAFLDAIHLQLGSCLSGSPTGIHVEFFKMTPEKPLPGTGLGPPVGLGDMGFTTAPSTASLPGEVSICLTLDGVETVDSERGPGGTRPAARKRNRKYLGPLGQTALSIAANTLEAVVSQALRDNLNAAFKTHMYDAMKGAGWGATIFSPTNWQVYPILRTWVDNAFDTQRRRGQDADLRSTTELPAAKEDFVEQSNRLGDHLVIDELGHVLRIG